MARASASARPLTDHEEIRRWAEERGAKPTCVRGTGDQEDIGMIRLDFPGYSGERSLEEIEWDDWFRKFDENSLALLVQDQTSGGQQSNFNKLVSRGTVEGKGARSRSARGSRTQRKSSTQADGSARRTRASSRSNDSESQRSRRATASSETRGGRRKSGTAGRAKKGSAAARRTRGTSGKKAA